VLIFSSLFRAASSMIHMVEIEAKVARAGATIRILDLAIDTATPFGRLTFNLFACIVQFERENMLESKKWGSRCETARYVHRTSADDLS
jgi:DNA invertase Pin-like site-specific DNA recombinase